MQEKILLFTLFFYSALEVKNKECKIRHVPSHKKMQFFPIESRVMKLSIISLNTIILIFFKLKDNKFVSRIDLPYLKWDAKKSIRILNNFVLIACI